MALGANVAGPLGAAINQHVPPHIRHWCFLLLRTAASQRRCVRRQERAKQSAAASQPVSLAKAPAVKQKACPHAPNGCSPSCSRLYAIPEDCSCCAAVPTRTLQPPPSKTPQHVGVVVFGLVRSDSMLTVTAASMRLQLLKQLREQQFVISVHVSVDCPSRSYGLDGRVDAPSRDICTASMVGAMLQANTSHDSHDTVHLASPDDASERRLYSVHSASHERPRERAQRRGYMRAMRHALRALDAAKLAGAAIVIALRVDVEMLNPLPRGLVPPLAVEGWKAMRGWEDPWQSAWAAKHATVSVRDAGVRDAAVRGAGVRGRDVGDVGMRSGGVGNGIAAGGAGAVRGATAVRGAAVTDAAPQRNTLSAVLRDTFQDAARGAGLTELTDHAGGTRDTGASGGGDADGGGGAMARVAAGSAPAVRAGCHDDCKNSVDGECDDGGPGHEWASCTLGHDCTDCGPRRLLDMDGLKRDLDATEHTAQQSSAASTTRQLPPNLLKGSALNRAIMASAASLYQQSQPAVGSRHHGQRSPRRSHQVPHHGKPSKKQARKQQQKRQQPPRAISEPPPPVPLPAPQSGQAYAPWIVVPDFGHYRQLNDRLSYGPVGAMRAFFTARAESTRLGKPYAEKGACRAARNLGIHVTTAPIKVVRRRADLYVPEVDKVLL